MDKTATYKVKNIGTANVFYKIPDMQNLRRSFVPGETKTISGEELERLTYIPGGTQLLREYLQVDKAVLDDLDIPNEPEDFMSEEQVKDLLLNGSIDEFLDALDFAKTGVIDLIKKYAVELPINDVQKREALKKKFNYDVTAIIAMKEAEKEEGIVEPKKAERRVIKSAESATETGRRTSKYNIVSK